jgi:hypothetical protein
MNRSFIALMMEAVRTSETSVYSNKTTSRYIPDGCNFILAAVRTSNLTNIHAFSGIRTHYRRIEAAKTRVLHRAATVIVMYL